MPIIWKQRGGHGVGRGGTGEPEQVLRGKASWEPDVGQRQGNQEMNQ